MIVLGPPTIIWDNNFNPNDLMTQPWKIASRIEYPACLSEVQIFATYREWLSQNQGASYVDCCRQWLCLNLRGTAPGFGDDLIKLYIDEVMGPLGRSDAREAAYRKYERIVKDTLALAMVVATVQSRMKADFDKDPKRYQPDNPS